MRDAGDRLTERRHLLGLQQLVIDVARLVVELLALADVADERLDPHAAVGRRRSACAGDLDPDGALIRPPQPEQVVGHRAVGGQPLEQRHARLRIDEALAIEGADVLLPAFRCAYPKISLR